MQDVNTIKKEVKILKERQYTISQIIKFLYQEYNWVGKDIISYETNQALRISQDKAHQEKTKKTTNPLKGNGKSRSRIQFVDKTTGQTVRTTKRKVQRTAPKWPPHKAGKKVSTVLRAKLPLPVLRTQLPAQPVSRSVHKLVDTKIRPRRIRTVSTRKPTVKKVVKGRVRKFNTKI